jgi:hypothetical protein
MKGSLLHSLQTPRWKTSDLEGVILLATPLSELLAALIRLKYTISVILKATWSDVNLLDPHGEPGYVLEILATDVLRPRNKKGGPDYRVTRI